jgi:hypothetical protein
MEMVRRAWRQYNSGCHFLAAEMLVAQEERTQILFDPNQSAIDSISLAEELRTIGESTVPIHGSFPILNSSATWKVPSVLQLARIEVIDRGGKVRIEAHGSALKNRPRLAQF